ncbi:MAG: YqgE/AlgH family protein [Planctomycetota bacterium]
MESELFVAQGTLLAASPDMLDPNFMHSVVLICQHTPEGAYGLVVNRPSGHNTAKVLADHPLWSRTEAELFFGGPVSLNQLQLLHSAGERVPGGVEVLKDVFLGGDLDVAARWWLDLPVAARASLRLVVGYSGWGAGQLESELERGSWIPAPGASELIFMDEPRNMWRAVLRSLGGDAAGLENLPPDPHWN